MVISTRTTTEDDHDCVRAVHHSAYRDVVFRQFGNWDVDSQNVFFAGKWASGNLRVLQCDGTDCGFVSVIETPSETRVVELVLSPEWQGRGIGTQYLRSVMDHAAASRVPVRLKVLLQNRAVEFYTRLGFYHLTRTTTHFELEWNDGSNSHGR